MFTNTNKKKKKMNNARLLVPLDQLARQAIYPVTIRTLLDFEKLGPVATAQFLQRELCIRLSHRVKDIQYLPYVFILRAPSISEVYNLYYDSLEQLDKFQSFSAANEEAFCRVLEEIVSKHRSVLPLMQRGYAELDAVCGGDQRLNREDLNLFLDRFLGTRIGNRVLAEHYFGLKNSRPDRIGAVNPNCMVKDVVKDASRPLIELIRKTYGVRTEISIRGDLHTSFSFIPEHLTFILNELLKNALRAQVERHLQNKGGKGDIPPVVVDIQKGLFDVTLKVSDRGPGIAPHMKDKVWKYGYTTAPQTSSKELCGYGFGLPLSRLYAQFFGGDIHIQSLYGHGTDCYICLNHLDPNGDDDGSTSAINFPPI